MSTRPRIGGYWGGKPAAEMRPPAELSKASGMLADNQTDPRTEPFEFEPGADMESTIMQAIGAASMCWENPAGAGVFDSEQAERIGQALLTKVRDYLVGEASLSPAVTADPQPQEQT